MGVSLLRMDDLKKIERSALSRAGRAKTREDIAQIRSDVLGKKGALGMALAGLKDVAAAERPKVGQAVNQIKAKVGARTDAHLVWLAIDAGLVQAGDPPPSA